MVLQYINIRQVPWKVLKTAAFTISSAELLQGMLNVNPFRSLETPKGIDKQCRPRSDAA